MCDDHLLLVLSICGIFALCDQLDGRMESTSRDAFINELDLGRTVDDVTTASIKGGSARKSSLKYWIAVGFGVSLPVPRERYLVQQRELARTHWVRVVVP